MARTGRPPRPADQRPIVIETTLRLYPGLDDDLIEYFRAFRPGLYATAVKRALRAGPLAGLPPGEASITPDDLELDEFVG